MKKPYIIAIAGGTCSGKSTLTDMVSEYFSPLCKTYVLNMDAYFKKEPPTVIAPITRVEYIEHNSPDTLELDRMFADFNKVLTGGEYALVIVEGLFALYLDEIREKADLKIFVDLDSDARLTRRITKHMQWGQTYEQVTERYLDTVKFRHNELIEPTRWHADVIINGVLDKNKGKEIVVSYIKSILEL